MNSKLEIMAIPRIRSTISEWLNTMMGSFLRVASQRKNRNSGWMEMVKHSGDMGIHGRGGASLNFTWSEQGREKRCTSHSFPLFKLFVFSLLPVALLCVFILFFLHCYFLNKWYPSPNNTSWSPRRSWHLPPSHRTFKFFSGSEVYHKFILSLSMIGQILMPSPSQKLSPLFIFSVFLSSEFVLPRICTQELLLLKYLMKYNAKISSMVFCLFQNKLSNTQHWRDDWPWA